MSTITTSPIAMEERNHRCMIGVRVETLGMGGLFVLVWLFSLSRSLFDPIGYDQGLYQYIAERVMAGQSLYGDIWEQNAPGIVAIHWLSTVLVGRSPMSLRVFDAGWQLLTMVALIGLVLRGTGRLSLGFVAGCLYAMAYYGMGYVQTAQREGFAVLPLLLAVHLFTSAHQARRRIILFGATAGFLAFIPLIIKTPLGACFGLLWLAAVAQGIRSRRQGLQAWRLASGLTMGFLIASGVAVAWMAQVGSLDGFWGVLSRRDMPGYVLGPILIRPLVPEVFAGFLTIAAAAVLVTGVSVHRAWRANFREYLSRGSDVAIPAAVGFMLLLTAWEWSQWQKLVLGLAGLWLPALGGIFLIDRSQRGCMWWLCLGMLAMTWAAVVLQGHHAPYQYPPVLAFAAYFAAVGLQVAFRNRLQVEAQPSAARGQRIWLGVCLAGIVYLAFGWWLPKMTFHSKDLFIPAATSLPAHYDNVTKHKLTLPTYTNSMQVADRVRELTAPDEPIGVLFHEMRLYYHCRRPNVSRLLTMQPAYKHMFDAFIADILRRRPKVLLARIPDAANTAALPHGRVDALTRQEVEVAVSGELLDFFGPPIQPVLDAYRVTEVIGRVCILQPRVSNRYEAMPGRSTRRISPDNG